VRFAGADPLYIQGDNALAGRCVVDIARAIKGYQPTATSPPGKVLASIIVGPSGRETATLDLESVRVLYQK
jgi:hypothetical protein